MSDDSPTTSDSRRLFFALWPLAEVRVRLAHEAAAAVRASGGKAVPERNLHVTLAFLGDVPEARVSEAHAAGAATVGAQFALAFDRLESWREARVLCMTSGAVPPALPALVESLRANLSARGFSIEGREFRPHVTLARHHSGRPPPSMSACEWHVDHFVLVESKRSAAGSAYGILGRWPLEVREGDKSR